MALISININTVAPIQFAASVNNILACLSDKVCKFLEKKNSTLFTFYFNGGYKNKNNEWRSC